MCDYLVVLAASRAQIAGEVDELLANHHRLIGPRRAERSLPANQLVVEADHTDVQSTLLVRTDDPILDPAWTIEQLGVEDLVLAYMGRAAGTPVPVNASAGSRGEPAVSGEVPVPDQLWVQAASTFAGDLGPARILTDYR